MSSRNTIIFKKSLLAIAVVSLSACSTPQRVQDYDLSRVGEGILSAGRTTADVSQRAWNKTTYLLGFTDSETLTDDGLLMDEVDLAMMEEDAPAETTPVIRPIVIQRAIVTEQTPTNEALVQQDQTPINLADGSTVHTGLDDAETAQPVIGAAEPAIEDLVGVEDLVHEVTANETLWDISKKTTGDATNWHLLADVNNLGPNASVFPGQQLIIPADMLKPDFDEAILDTHKAANADIKIDTQDVDAIAIADNQRLNIPEGNESVDLVETVPVAQPEGRAFELNQGETLWDFAKRTTGDATNWQAIASQNNFSEKQAVVVRAGQTIYVPEDLVRSELDVAQNLEQKNLEQTPIIDSTEPTAVTLVDSAEFLPTDQDQEAIQVSSQLIADASTLDETQPIKIVEATFKADESLQPINVESIVEAEPTTPDTINSEPVEIMVSGTYYPKAVYNDADFSSSLLMRVSPGTTLQVSKAMGNWFEVSTDKGVGYVHARDIK